MGKKNNLARITGKYNYYTCDWNYILLDSVLGYWQRQVDKLSENFISLK